MDEWTKGYNDAVSYCRDNYTPFQPMKMPTDFVHRGNNWSRGFAEGLLTEQNKIINERYPGNIGFSVSGLGKVKVFYPQGHNLETH